jgi:hypothetical protein
MLAAPSFGAANPPSSSAAPAGELEVNQPMKITPERMKASAGGGLIWMKPTI